jgi:glucosylceramidase
MKEVVLGAVRNWGRAALEWNLASDPAYGPHTPGGCDACLGALTIGGTITRNPSYYVIAQAAKFVRSGSVRVASNLPRNYPTPLSLPRPETSF